MQNTTFHFLEITTSQTITTTHHAVGHLSICWSIKIQLIRFSRRITLSPRRRPSQHSQLDDIDSMGIWASIDAHCVVSLKLLFFWWEVFRSRVELFSIFEKLIFAITSRILTILMKYVKIIYSIESKLFLSIYGSLEL